jgi:HSP20 family protein
MANDKQKQGGQGMERSASSAGERGGAMQRGQGGDLGSHRGGVLSPFALMRRMMEDMDRMFADFGAGGSLMPRSTERGFGGLSRSFNPEVEVFQREGKLVVRADLPGMRQDDVHVSLDEDGLVLKGERRHEEEREEGGIFHSERSYGSFQRRIPLPRGVDPSTCDASFDDGVLEVSLNLPEQGSKRIEVRSGKAQEGGRAAEPKNEGERQETQRRPEAERDNGTQAPPARH